MSSFSGKCDIYDWFCMIPQHDHMDKELEEEIQRTDFYIYQGGHNHRLDIHTLKDLVPYFAYTVVIGCGCKEGRQTIVMSSMSQPDHEEAERLTSGLNDAKREYRSCKRKKIPFNPKAWANKYSWWGKKTEYQEIGKRVAEFGEKANIDGIHIDFFDKYDRRNLALEMSRFGYEDDYIDRWVYQGRNYDWRKTE